MTIIGLEDEIYPAHSPVIVDFTGVVGTLTISVVVTSSVEVITITRQPLDGNLTLNLQEIFKLVVKNFAQSNYTDPFDYSGDTFYNYDSKYHVEGFDVTFIDDNDTTPYQVLVIDSAQQLGELESLKLRKNFPLHYIGCEDLPLVQDEFIFEAETEDPNQTFTLPLVSGGVYDFFVNWGDGSSGLVTGWTDTDKTHIYSSAGVYVIRIVGICNGWRFAANTFAPLMKNILQFGNLLVGSGVQAFDGCVNMTVTATDELDTSSCTDMTGMFRDCSLVDFDISTFNMESVTDASEAFDNTGFTKSHYDAALIAWSAQSVLNGVKLGVDLLRFSIAPSAAATARHTLTTTYLWVISGDTGI